MPEHLKRLQFRVDSIRAREWFEMTKDSSYLEKYLGTGNGKFPAKKKEPSRKANRPDAFAILRVEKTFNKNRPFFLIYS
jgi:hypothetical protein